jgi:hypothetical protein
MKQPDQRRPMKTVNKQASSKSSVSFPMDRTIQDSDWKFGDIRLRPKGRSSPDEKKRMQMLCYYEYARDCSILREWANNRDNRGWPKSCEFGAILERQLPECYHLLMQLASELGSDLPWKLIPKDKIDMVLSHFAKENILDIEGDAQKTDPWPPSYLMSIPSGLRPAYDHECTDTLTWEKWVRCADKKRPGVEFITLKVEWAHKTNAELGSALAYWRPDHIPEPQCRRKAHPGKAKVSDYTAWLRDLGVARLLHSFPSTEAADLASAEFGIQRRDILCRCKIIAEKTFKDTFAWLENHRSFLAANA